jgi:serine/threonine protein kinase
VGSVDDDFGDDDDGGPIAAAVVTLPARLGRYTLTRRLAFGGMAEVFLAREDGDGDTPGRVCVVKRMLPQLADDPRFVELFRREARLASRLQHPNLVAIDALDEANGSVFVAMDFVDGVGVDVLARTAWSRGRAVPVEVAGCIAADVAAGLDYAHRLTDDAGRRLGLVHRDVSPDNILVDRDGNARLLDFGIAKSALPGDRTRTGDVKGKTPFFSPEQVVGMPLDGRSDLHALGVVLYWLLTGRRPFAADVDLQLLQQIVRLVPEPPAAVNPAVPPVVSALVMQLLEKDRDRRPSCGAEVRERLAAALPARRPVVIPFVVELADVARAGSVPPVSTAGLPATVAVPALWRAASTLPTPSTTPTSLPAALPNTSSGARSAAPSPSRAPTNPAAPAALPVTTSGTKTKTTAWSTPTPPPLAAARAEMASAAKGVVVAPMVARLKHVMREKGLTEVPALLPDDLRLIRYERVLATAYYPLDLYHRVIAAAHVVGWGGDDAGARQMGVDAATDALRGVYRVFLTEGDPERTLSTAPRVWAAHYRGSSAGFAVLAPQTVQVTIRDYGPMPRVLQLINLAWTETCARLAGADDATATGAEVDGSFVATIRWTRSARR